MFRDMTITKKILLGFGGALLSMAIGVLAVGVVAHNARKASEVAEHKGKVSFEMAMRAQRMRMDVVQVQQWLTDISATRGLDGLDDGFEQAKKRQQSFAEHLAAFRSFYEKENDQEHLQELAQIETRFAAYYEAGTKMAEAYVQGGPEAGNKMMGEFDATASALNELIQPFVEEQALAGGEQLAQINTSLQKLQASVFIGGLLAICGGIAVSLLITRTIVRTLTSAIDNLNEGAAQVAAAAGQIAQSSQALAEGASEQAAALEESSASLEEMASTTRQNAENAGQAHTIMQATERVVADANRSMEELTSSMAEVAKASEATSKIIKTIDEIAFQTNLLALNAAVEAARAGEAGAGFAVVADEVRNLAMRAAEAARDTSGLIEGTVQRVQQSSTLVEETNHAFAGVSERSVQIGQLITEITTASQEQSRGLDQISKAVNEMDRVTQQNAAAAEESASASEELSAQSEVMQGTVQDLAAMAGATVHTSPPRQR